MRGTKTCYKEWANPRVRPLVSIYPEDGKGFMSDFRHGAKWLRRMPPDSLTPMIRIANQDFYIFEPCRLHDERVIMPFKWYMERVGEDDSRLCGSGWLMEAVNVPEADECGWIVKEHTRIEFQSSDLCWNFPKLEDLTQSLRIPSMLRILGKWLITSIEGNGGGGSDRNLGHPTSICDVHFIRQVSVSWFC